MRRAHCYLLILLAFWLPLQAVAAWTMPLCRHAEARAAQQAQAAQVVGAHCHEAVPVVPAQNDPTQGDDCDNCGICHLATSGYLPPLAGATASGPATDTPVALTAAVPASHIGEPPQRPPGTTN